MFKLLGGAAQPTSIKVEMTLPANSDGARSNSRTVCYACRVVRAMRIGPLLGVGVELIEKLG